MRLKESQPVRVQNTTPLPAPRFMSRLQVTRPQANTLGQQPVNKNLPLADRANIKCFKSAKLDITIYYTCYKIRPSISPMSR